MTSLKGKVVDVLGTESNDLIKVFIPNINPEHNEEKSETDVNVSASFVNRGKKAKFKGTSRTIKQDGLHIAYPLFGGTSTTSGVSCKPEVGDYVRIIKIDDLLYYFNGYNVVGEGENNTRIKLSHANFYPMTKKEKEDDWKEEDKVLMDVLFLSKLKVGIAVSRLKDKLGLILTTTIGYLHFNSSDKYIALTTDTKKDSPEDNYAVYLDQGSKEVRVYNGSGICFIKSNADGSFVIETNTEGLIKTPNFTVDADLTTVTGDLVVNGNTNIKGTTTSDGLITGNSDVKFGSITLGTHKHTGNLGSPTSPPI